MQIAPKKSMDETPGGQTEVMAAKRQTPNQTPKKAEADKKPIEFEGESEFTKT